jgi:hypothetical protein
MVKMVHDLVSNSTIGRKSLLNRFVSKMIASKAYLSLAVPEIDNRYSSNL